MLETPVGIHGHPWLLRAALKPKERGAAGWERDQQLQNDAWRKEVRIWMDQNLLEKCWKITGNPDLCYTLYTILFSATLTSNNYVEFMMTRKSSSESWITNPPITASGKSGDLWTRRKAAEASHAAFGYLDLNKQSLKIIRANMKRMTKTKNTITAVQYPEASSQLAKAIGGPKGMSSKKGKNTTETYWDYLWSSSGSFETPSLSVSLHMLKSNLVKATIRTKKAEKNNKYQQLSSQTSRHHPGVHGILRSEAPRDARPFLPVLCPLLGIGDAHQRDIDLALPGGSHPHLG